MKIELTYEQEDKVIVKSLKRYIKCVIDPEYDPYETQENKDRSLTSLLETLSLFTTPYEYETFVRKNNL